MTDTSDGLRMVQGALAFAKEIEGLTTKTPYRSRQEILAMLKHGDIDGLARWLDVPIEELEQIRQQMRRQKS